MEISAAPREIWREAQVSGMMLCGLLTAVAIYRIIRIALERRR
jgi:hypothetical protein